MERWSAIDAEDVHLATIRVYSEAIGASGKKPRIVLFLPPNSPNNSQPGSQSPNPNRPVFNNSLSYPSSVSEPDSYELDMVNDAVDNQMVVAERPKDSLPNQDSGPINPRARTTILTGRIKHDCNLRPVFTESYRRQMKERSKKYNTPHRQIKMIEEAGVSGGRGGINRLSSGVGVGSGNAFESLIVRSLPFVFLVPFPNIFWIIEIKT
jgi:transcription initiation factor TFIIF subunit beta